MTNISFRPAQELDLPVIISMLADDKLGAKREDASLPVNPKYSAAFEAIDKDPNQYLAVVEQEEEIIGCLQLTFIPGLSRLGMWRGQIESVRIASSHRGSGLGSQMFEWAISECRKHGCELVQLTTDKARPDAFKFYEKFGFKASHEGMKLSLD
ncbi:GNAT family acetyltransferase [Kiloniella spongiae]|uniref:GNAT family acetyltransferase n=1 Tax=Kiloniella spongiae TaxID=1489064 RepID=A0A0H2MHY3_9PROT|nr:GNAT family N-acetyltransferase [Kiloniella spongiae]KLN62199.1 GNAT family acetyltransferase [Kiloniella spongiae]